MASEFEGEYERKCWKDFFAGFLEKYAESCGVFRTLEREKNIREPVGGIRITGRIDRVDEIPDGLEIIDYKTSPSPGAKFKKTALLNRMADGRQVALPVYFRALGGAAKISVLWLADYEETDKYPLKISVCPSDKHFPEALAGMEKAVSGALEGMKKGLFMPEKFCGKKYSCRYENICGFLTDRINA